MSKYISTIYNTAERPYTSYPRKLVEHLCSRFDLKEGMRLLEIGCGRGEFLQEFKELGLDVYGVDISSEAANFDDSIVVQIVDIQKEELDFKDGFFDVVYSKSLLEHLENPDKYFAEALRLLKKGGKLITLVPDWESNYKIYFDDHTHKTPFTTVSLNVIYKMHSFSNISVFKFRQLPIVWKYPFINYFSAAIAPFVPIRCKIKFLRWSKELMLVGVGIKNDGGLA